MSDVINDRERGEERKFQMDQETQFKAEARRNKLLGHWLAEAFGMGPAETEEYAKAVVMAAKAVQTQPFWCQTTCRSVAVTLWSMEISGQE